MQTSRTTGLLDKLINNFGIKFFLGLTKEKDEGGRMRESAL
jgi:hypothetical protein